MIWNHEIECWEDEDPHQVDEVPVQAEYFKLTRMRIALVRVALEPHEEHWNHAANHVEGVETRHQEVEAVEQRMILLRWEVAMAPLVTVFNGFDDEESNCAEDGQPQERLLLAAIPMLRMVNAQGHRQR